MHNVHLQENMTTGWTIRHWDGAVVLQLGRFQSRVQAEAMGRAVAHHCHVELVVRQANGVVTRVTGDALSYPRLLE